MKTIILMLLMVDAKGKSFENNLVARDIIVLLIKLSYYNQY